MKPFLGIVTALVCVAALGVTWKADRMARDAAGRFAAVQLEAARTNDAIKLAENRLAAAERETSPFRSALDKLQREKLRGADAKLHHSQRRPRLRNWRPPGSWPVIPTRNWHDSLNSAVT